MNYCNKRDMRFVDRISLLLSLGVLPYKHHNIARQAAARYG
ncbi:hypothetical protein HMPREF3293_01243 [Christensenella minuta]|uniref:Uncharacterized protein n=1 Tax=Christensenella minuta TaxID=626937 RepID=A0A136Q5K1_9FIRM|nr:hypothetical protein HMPREF3293_01243 [Christensenella minuta]